MSAMMQFVRIYETQASGQVEAGRIVWDGTRLEARAANAEYRILMENMLEPARYHDAVRGRWVRVTKDDPPAFLRALQHAYTGSYLRCGQVETVVPTQS